ncbi:MAG: hypothetical protein EOP06_05340 [Proteobacteria bacterium]|nr:MAG: hypothetical protein EOP06_05340 [Pseudomonadota bacterium]
MQKSTYAEIAKKLNFDPSPSKLRVHLLLDGGLLLIIFFTYHSVFYPISQLIIPILMFRAFALMHECVHNSACRVRWISDVVGIVAGAICLLPYEPWKKIHLAHHKWTGNVDKDPSMGLIKHFPHFSRTRIAILNLLWKFHLPGLAVSQHFIFWAKSYTFILAGNRKDEKLKNALSVIVPLTLYAFIPWASMIPALAIYLAMVEIINFPHHLQMPMLQDNESFPVYDQHKTARSCIYPRWFARHVLNNFNLHIEHHLFPRLPWYRLNAAQGFVSSLELSDYTAIEGNRWIKANRSKPLNEVLGTNFTNELEKAA